VGIRRRNCRISSLVADGLAEVCGAAESVGVGVVHDGEAGADDGGGRVRVGKGTIDDDEFGGLRKGRKLERMHGLAHFFSFCLSIRLTPKALNPPSNSSRRTHFGYPGPMLLDFCD
jgi:hypothetical protein